MPKLWSETIDAHRAAVREATLDATAVLVAEHGLSGVTMSQIAKRTGIGRATLYKYFPDVEAIVTAWHQRQIAAHLEELTQARDASTTSGQQLPAVLRAYAHASRRHGDARLAGDHSNELAMRLHRGAHVTEAEQQLRALLAEIIAAAAADGHVRSDIPAAELASYCLHALSAAGAASSRASLERLVDLTLSALRPNDPMGGPGR